MGVTEGTGFVQPGEEAIWRDFTAVYWEGRQKSEPDFA